jgi:nucleoside-diphosphate-sugar epimerase
MRQVLVTGASGMIGLRVVERLAERGVSVRALVRERTDTRSLRAYGVEIVQLLSGGAVPLAAFQAVDAVIHAAGALSTGAAFSRGDRAARRLYQAVNVELTEQLLTGARAAGARRFVFLSSCAVYATPTSAGLIDEDAPLGPESDYGVSKVAAERRVAAAQAAGLSTTIVRPCIVSGPGDRHFAPAAAALARLPLLPLPDSGGRIDLAHVDDVADLVVLCLQAPAADGRIYNATSDCPVALKDIIDGLARRLGLRAHVVPASARTLTRLRPLLLPILRILAPRTAPLLGSIALRYLIHDAAFDLRRARTELGFRPQWSAEGVLDALVAATRAQHQ